MTPGFTVIRDSTPAALIPKGTVVAMGNFDGVHLGHRAVIAAALRMAHTHGRPALAVTFEPHPRRFFSPTTPQFRLTDETAKLRLLAGTGLAGAVVMTFDKARAGTSAQDFIHHDLIERLGISGIAVGYDFHFGKGRVGSPGLLVNEAPRLGIEVDVQAHVDIEERPVSSSAIRMALAEGQIDDATRMLGAPWFVTGEVIHGEKRGRDLGFPTANIRLDANCGLKHGIYAVRVGRGAERFDGVASFGRRPTFDNGAPLLEVFLFDFTGDLYGAVLDVAFIGFIREELRFDSVDALVVQMNDDSARARTLLAASPEAFPTARDRRFVILRREPTGEPRRISLSTRPILRDAAQGAAPQDDGGTAADANPGRLCDSPSGCYGKPHVCAAHHTD